MAIRHHLVVLATMVTGCGSPAAFDDASAPTPTDLADGTIICRGQPVVSLSSGSQDSLDDPTLSYQILAPLLDRTGVCMGTHEDAVVAESLRRDRAMYFGQPYEPRDISRVWSARRELPVNREGLFMMAIADANDKLVGYEVFAVNTNYNCRAMLEPDAQGVPQVYAVQAYTPHHSQPLYFSDLGVMGAATTDTPGLECVHDLQFATDILQSDEYRAAMALSFARRISRGARIDI